VRIAGIGFNESRVLQIPPLALDDCRGEGCKSLFSLLTLISRLPVQRETCDKLFWAAARWGAGAEAEGSLSTNKPNAYETQSPLCKVRMGHGSSSSHVLLVLPADFGAEASGFEKERKRCNPFASIIELSGSPSIVRLLLRPRPIWLYCGGYLRRSDRSQGFSACTRQLYLQRP
jgi:hypothetical protein